MNVLTLNTVSMRHVNVRSMCACRFGAGNI